MNGLRRIIGGLGWPGGNGEASKAEEATFQRVVLLAPFWARWKDLGRACDAYLEVVDRLSHAPAGDQAWFIHDFEREAQDRKLDEKLAAVGSDVTHLYQMWHWLKEREASAARTWTEVGAATAEAASGVVTEGLRQCAAGVVPEVAADGAELLSDQLNLFSVRFFFDQAHFSRFLCDAVGPFEGAGDGRPYTVCIDLRFDIKADAYWTFATLSLWSDWPRHEDIAPQSARPRRPEVPELTLEQLRGRRSAFEDVTERFECFLHGPALAGGAPAPASDGGSRGLGWSRPRLEVFDGAYRSPRFWFVVPTARPRSPMAYWADGEGPGCLLRPLAECFLELSDPRADSVSVAQLRGEYLVQRRFIHEHHGTPAVGDEPTYLLLPGQGAAEQSAEEQEEAGYVIARSLLELEWHAATVLFQVDSELEVARTHVKMYEAIARQAGVLLDALVLHLPGINGKGLRMAHDGIELVHQTLLQGIADLADMTTVVQAAVRTVGDGADELKARFDRKLDQQAVPDRPDIRVSLAERGLFSRLEEQARDDMALAERVQTRYQSLLQEITMAFEERRVREADKLERYSGTIALLFGVVGVVTALEATFDFHWNSPPDGVLGGMGVVVGVVAAGLVGIIAAGLATYRRVGKLGTRGFPHRYREVWSFLASTSTDSLHELKAAIDEHPDDVARLWNQVDRRFSDHLARLWDAHPPRASRQWIRSLPVPGAAPRPSIRGRFRGRDELQRLTAQVESFVCRTMLVSERTPRLNHFGLPRLALLYRLLSATRTDGHTHPTPRLVSDFDVCASIGNAGYPAENWETYLTWERELLDHERRTAGETTATALLDRIHATGLRHGLGPQQARGVVQQLWRDVEAWRQTPAELRRLKGTNHRRTEQGAGQGRPANLA